MRIDEKMSDVTIVAHGIQQPPEASGIKDNALDNVCAAGDYLAGPYMHTHPTVVFTIPPPKSRLTKLL